MSHLDEELARVAVENDAPPTAESANQAATPVPQRNVGLLVALLIVGGALVALVLSFKEAAVYAKTVDQLVAEKTRLTGRPVRVEGDLVKGSLVHQASPCEYRFRMAHQGAEIPVRYGQCVVPDTFQDRPDMDVKVTVEGKLQEDGHFEATLVMAKCPSKYDMKERARKGEKAPHAM
ncbi:MAG: cytochrome c maturation protein CcmE [Myxococcales bacterium]|nr:cytochrome c maturation protein CcmE [Polyangiaceae bacterium]MDW8249328.1 cytochrome c maturation protein CcmE [Myxococcales bacterium]